MYSSIIFNLSVSWWVGSQHHVLAALPPLQRADTHCIGGWVGPRAGLDGHVKSCHWPGLDPRNICLASCIAEQNSSAA